MWKCYKGSLGVYSQTPSANPKPIKQQLCRINVPNYHGGGGGERELLAIIIIVVVEKPNKPLKP